MAYRRGGWSQDPFFRRLDMAEQGYRPEDFDFSKEELAEAEKELSQAPDVPLKPGEADRIVAKVMNEENKQLRARVRELEAENERLKVEREDFGERAMNWHDDAQHFKGLHCTQSERIAKLEAENGELKAWKRVALERGETLLEDTERIAKLEKALRRALLVIDKYADYAGSGALDEEVEAIEKALAE